MLINATVSPPATIDVIFNFKIESAIAFDPSANSFNSYFPSGPFQNIVFALLICLEYASRVFGPISKAFQPVGIIFYI